MPTSLALLLVIAILFMGFYDVQKVLQEIRDAIKALKDKG